MRRRESGLTLVEVLVVVVLISMMLVLTGAAQRMMAQVMHRAGSHIDRFDDARILPGLIRSTLGTASTTALRLAGAEEPRPYFVGMTDEIEWLGRLPVRYGAGGMNYLRIAGCSAGAGVGADTCLFWAPLGRSREAPDWAGQPGHRLLSAPARIRFWYRSAQAPDWQPEWIANGEIPAAVLVVLELQDNAIPVLVRLDTSAVDMQVDERGVRDWLRLSDGR